MAPTNGIVSIDDHIVEPAHLWTSRLPQKYLDVGPRVVRERGQVELKGGQFSYVTTEDGNWTDCWHYEDLKLPLMRIAASVGFEVDEVENIPITFDDMRKGCYDPAERLADMDVAGIEASLCFPNLFVRFCGQTFAEAQDKELALLCVKAYNDFVHDEWCAGSGGRLIPMAIMPLWDPELCAAEVRRNAARGFPAACFSELPTYLGLPSIHSGHWDPFLRACDETDTAILMHIGSGSKLVTTSADAPLAVTNTVGAVNTALSLTDWLFSKKLQQFPNLRIGFAESNIGWVPYFKHRADTVWEHTRNWNEVGYDLPNPPSTYIPDRVFFSFFDDKYGISVLDAVGPGQVMFETDYPHADSNWPVSSAVAADQTKGLSDEAREKVIRGNALRFLRLDA